MPRTRLVLLGEEHVASIEALEELDTVRDAIQRPALDRAALLERVSGSDPDVASFVVMARCQEPRESVAGWVELRRLQVPPLECGTFEVYLDPRCHGRGLGREVIAHLPTMLMERWGLDVILIGVYEDNAVARRLYESLGYGEVDRQWHYPARGARRRWLMLSNAPERFTRRKAGFSR